MKIVKEALSLLMLFEGISHVSAGALRTGNTNFGAIEELPKGGSINYADEDYEDGGYENNEDDKEKMGTKSYKESYSMKYNKKWPHCVNLECSNNTNWNFRKELEAACDRDSECTGFSFSTGKTSGSGCLKKCGIQEFGGYGANTHDYWVKRYSMKYHEMWPHCTNLVCMSGSRDFLEATCDRYSECTGFSFSTGKTSGSGCLKKCGTQEFGGYGIDTHDYWEKIE